MVASVGFFLAFLDATIVNIAFPDIAESFPDSDLGALSWILNAYNVIFAAFLLPAGKIADLYGRKRMFRFGLLAFTLGSLLCAVAPSVEVLVGFRMLQAIGAAAMVPAGLALVIHGFELTERSHAIALISAVGALAAGIGPSVGGFLIAVSDWRAVFIVNVPIGIAAYLLAGRSLTESRHGGRKRFPDGVGAMLAAVGVGALVVGIVNGEDWGWTSLSVLGFWALAVASLAAFVRRSYSHPAPMVEAVMFSSRTFVAANALSVIGAAGFFGYTLINVLYLTGVWNYTVLEAGLAITPGPFVAAAIAGPASKLALRVGYRSVIAVGALVWAAGLLWFVLRVGLEPSFLGEWLPGVILLGIGAGIAFPNLSAAAIASAPGEQFATATGLSSVVRQVGAAIGVALVVAILGMPESLEQAAAAFENAWLFSALAMLLVSVGSVLIKGELGEPGESMPALGDAVRAALRRPHARRFSSTPSRIINLSAPTSPQRAQSGRESIAEFLGRVPLFANLDRAQLERIAAEADEISAHSGQEIFSHGDPADAMYVVRAGRVEAVGTSGQVLRELGRGTALGELALITGEPRSASVRAARHCELLSVSKPRFEELLESSPEILKALNLQLARQLQVSRGVDFVSRPLPATIALIAIGETAGVRRLAGELAEELSQHLHATTLGEDDAPLPGADPDASVFGPMLDRAEASNDVVVLIAAADSSEAWRRFCGQQGDRLLLVAAPETQLREAVDPSWKGADLVCLDVESGSGALAKVVEAIEPYEHHLVRPDHNAKDVARMARRLSGRSVGLVLSGGGARGLSHIGVLETLRGAGVMIDRVAGVSMGAYIGGLHAAGLDPSEIDAICYEHWVRNYPLNDWSVPRYGMIHGKRFLEMLESTFGGVRFEEVERSFFCASADLKRSELVVHRSGRLVDHISTSMCVPILAPPQVRGDRTLIDGGLINNLPVAEMAESGEGPVIAVDVRAGRGEAERPEEPDGRRREQKGREPKLAGGGPPPAGLGETLGRLFFLASTNTAEASRKYANLVIEPRATGVGLLEFHQIDVAVDAGRRAAEQALEAAPDELLEMI